MSTRGLAWLVFLPECRPDALLGIKLLDASNAEYSTAGPGSSGSLSFCGILALGRAGTRYASVRWRKIWSSLHSLWRLTEKIKSRR